MRNPKKRKKRNFEVSYIDKLKINKKRRKGLQRLYESELCDLYQRAHGYNPGDCKGITFDFKKWRYIVWDDESNKDKSWPDQYEKLCELKDDDGQDYIISWILDHWNEVEPHMSKHDKMIIFPAFTPEEAEILWGMDEDTFKDIHPNWDYRETKKKAEMSMDDRLPF